MKASEQRRFRRFNVAGIDEVQCRIQSLDEKLKLASLGFGGCGFYCLEPESRLQAPENPELERKKRFQVYLTFGSNWDLELQANLLYEKRVEINNTLVFYYGFEFIEAEREKVKPIIEKLEELHEKGEISAA